ncbi:MAG: hypothetical protein RSA06_05520 [Erysipelotrichaceae bacterium]
MRKSEMMIEYSNTHHRVIKVKDIVNQGISNGRKTIQVQFPLLINNFNGY